MALYRVCINVLTVTVSEVEALSELFKKMSSSIYNDGLIHKVSISMDLLTYSE